MNENQSRLPEDINVILFHATKREKLGIIMKEGLKPRTGKGGITPIVAGEPYFNDLEYAKNYVYFYPSFGIIQADYQLFKDAGIDTILIVGMPSDRVIVPMEDISINEYSEKYDYRERFEDLLEVVVKGTVGPEYIIACLEIVEMEPIELHSWKYKPMNCRK